jgi:hypothetical protein
LLLLVHPRQPIKQYAANLGFARLLGRKTGMVPLALPYLAALVPDNWDIRIIDEEIEPIPERLAPDLVGITALTTNVSRGYAIADMFRAKGVTVVMGGPYVSVCPDEALTHADCLMIGEAETTLAPLLADFLAGTLRKTYQPDGFVEYKSVPAPRWDLVNTRQMSAIPVQASRGCPHSCEFCLTSELFGHKMRYRDIDNVIAEIQSLPLTTIFFVDDNLTANKNYARELMARLKPLKLQWFCMASIEIAKFPDLLEAMADAGCMHILIGFETLNPGSLAEAQKVQNRADNYAAAIEAIHRAGINVNGSYIVGFDHDTLAEYDRLHEFFRKTNSWYPNINILDVIPGSRLYQRILSEGRWAGRPADFSGGFFPVMHYMQLSQMELFERNLEFLRTIFSPADIRTRIIPLFSTGWFKRGFSTRDVSPLRKFLMSITLVKAYCFNGDPEKRGLFLDLVKLFRSGVVSVDKVVFFLVTLEGINRLLASYTPHIEEWKAMIRQSDRGSWISQTGPRSGAESDPSAG